MYLPLVFLRLRLPTRQEIDQRIETECELNYQCFSTQQDQSADNNFQDWGKML